MPCEQSAGATQDPQEAAWTKAGRHAYAGRYIAATVSATGVQREPKAGYPGACRQRAEQRTGARAAG